MIEVDSYLEAAGVVVALANGIALESLRRPIGRVRVLDLLGEAAARKAN